MGLTPSRFRRYQTHQARYEAAEYRDYQLEESNRPEMPGHWHFRFDWLPWPLNKVFEKSLRMLCLVAFGHSDLEALHYVCVASEKTWMESTSRLADRLNTIIVVAGLLLSSTAAFATTPPPLVNILNYNERGPYLCLLISFGLSLGTLIVGSTILFVVSKCEPEWFIDTHMGSQSRIMCTMWLIAYPFVSMGLSTVMAAFGLLVAAWTSQDGLVVKGAVWLLLVPASCLPVWWWTQWPVTQVSAEKQHLPMTSSSNTSTATVSMPIPQPVVAPSEHTP